MGKVLFLSQNQELNKNLISELDKLEKNSFSFCADSEQAVNLLNDGNFTTVVTNFNSEHERELKFLELLKNAYPNIYRGTFAEDFFQQKSLQSLNITHRILRRPVKAFEVELMITQFSKLTKYNLAPTIVSAINGFGTIPVLPDLYTRLQKEIDNPEASIHRIADIISLDPLMTAKILHLVNSSFFMITKGVTNLIQAINFLGVNIVKSLFLYIKIFSADNSDAETKNSLRKLRVHSINVAKITKAIIGLESFEREYIELAFLTGLLHDIGKLVLLQIHGKKNIVSICESETPQQILESEVKHYGASHLDIGAYLLSLWGFDEELIDAVISHHDSTILTNSVMTLKKALFVADSLVCGYNSNLKLISETFGPIRLAGWNELIPSEDDNRLVA